MPNCTRSDRWNFGLLPTRRSRWWFLTIAILQVAVAGGAFFGWSSIESVLRRDGQFESACSQAEGNDCADRDLKFSQIYQVGSVVSLLAPFVWGVALDHLGDAIVARAAWVAFATGCVLLGVSDSENFNAFIPAAILLAVASQGLLYSTYRCSLYFPQHRGLILTLLNGAFDSSAMVFLIIGEVQRSQGFDGKSVIVGYVVAVVVPLGLAVGLTMPQPKKQQSGIDSLTSQLEVEAGHASAPEFTQPDTNGKWDTTQGKEEDPVGSSTARADGDERSAVIVSASEEDRMAHIECRPAQAVALEVVSSDESSQPKPGQPEPKPKLQPEPQQGMATVFRQPLFWLFALFVSANLLRFFWFLGTVSGQLRALGDDGVYINVFGVLLPSCAIAAFGVGTIIDRFGPIVMVVITCALSTLAMAFNLIPSLPVQVVTFILLGIYRSALFSSLASFAAFTFGYQRMGRVLGTAFLFGAAAALLQFPLSTWAVDTLDDSYLEPNLVILGWILLSWALPFAVLLRLVPMPQSLQGSDAAPEPCNEVQEV